MNLLTRKIEINIITLVLIIVVTGVASVHISQTEFGSQTIPEIVAIIGLCFVGMGIYMFLHLFQQLYGKSDNEGDEK
ncbi:MAG: hypothetical protein ACE5F3_01335 [Mariprofundaceae bacterium]